MIDESIPAELEAIVFACLVKNPTGRYSSSHDLAQALRDCLPNPERIDAFGETKSIPPRQFPARIVFVTILTMIGLLIGSALFWWHRQANPPNTENDDNTTTKLSSSDTVDALTGEVRVTIWDPDDKNRQGLTLDDPAVLPLQAGDQFRVEAEVSRPLYLYLLWIQPDGRVDPIYPWKPGDWTSYPESDDVRQQRLSLPEKKDRGWEIVPTGGMDTLVLLARKTPLPPEFDLESLVSGFPPQTYSGPTSLVLFDHKVTAEPTPAGLIAPNHCGAAAWPLVIAWQRLLRKMYR